MPGSRMAPKPSRWTFNAPPIAKVPAIWSGGGGIRTLGTGVTGTTVFETARFNHSRTPPRAVWRVAQRAPRGEEVGQQRRAFRRQHAALDGGAVVEARLREHVEHAARRPRLRVGGPVDHAAARARARSRPRTWRTARASRRARCRAGASSRAAARRAAARASRRAPSGPGGARARCDRRPRSRPDGPPPHRRARRRARAPAGPPRSRFLIHSWSITPLLSQHRGVVVQLLGVETVVWVPCA